MNNKKKSAPISMFVMIAVIGLVISAVNGDLGEISAIFEGLDTGTLDTLLDTINLGLGFLTLAGVFIFFFIRATRDKKEYYWDFEKEDIREED